MNSVDDLLRTLETHAGDAPDGFGILQHAEVGARRLRRRRTIARMSAAAVAIAVATAGIPVVWSRSHSAPMQVGDIGSKYSSTRFTVDVVPGRGYAVTGRTTQVGGDYMEVMATGAGTQGLINRGAVFAYAPDTVDPVKARRGQHTTVAGRDAWYVRPADNHFVSLKRAGESPAAPIDFLPSMESASLNWQDSSGLWLTAVVSLTTYEPGRPQDPSAPGGGGLVPTPNVNSSTLAKLAEAIRVGPPRDLPMPFRLGWLPDGLQILKIRQNVMIPGITTKKPQDMTISGVIALGYPASYEGPTINGGLDISTTVVGISDKPDHGPGASDTTIAGHPVWYRTVMGGGPPTGLYLQARNCSLLIAWYSTPIPLEQVRKMIESMTFGDCKDESTWMPIGH